MLVDHQSNSDRLVNNTPRSTSRIFKDLMTVDEVMNFHASFHEFGIPLPGFCNSIAMLVSSMADGAL
jgi:hypothetical protein